MRFLLPALLWACSSEDTDAAPDPVDPAFTLVVLPDTQYLSLDPDNGVLARMMDQLIAEHPDHRVIVLTHAYLGPSGTVASQGVDIQARLVDPHPNVEMVLNGHFTGDTRARARRERVDGSEVLEIFANYQTLPTSGFGRMRQMRLNTEEGTLEVTSCNAYAVCSDEDGDAFFETGVDWAN